MKTRLTTQMCDCFNDAHTFPRDTTPNGNPGHDASAKFAVVDMIHLGTMLVCRDCARDCQA